MSLLTKRYVLLSEIESVYDTDPTPTAAANAVIVENLRLGWPNEVIDPQVARGDLSPSAPIQGRKYGTLEYDIPIAGSGSAGVAADWGPHVEACGFTEAVVADTSVTYTPLSASWPSITHWAYRDGLLYKFNGCRGNVSFNFPAGQRAMMHFMMSGHCVDAADAALASPTVDATIAPIVVGSSFTIASYAGIIAALQVDMQNDVQMTSSVNAASGYGAAEIVDRHPQGSIDPEAVLVGTHDFWSKWEDSTQQAVTITVGATAGNIATFTLPKATYRTFAEGDRNGVLIYELPFACARNAGNDEVSLAMT